MNQPLRALLVEDSHDDARLILRTLERGGYDVHWDRVETAEAMSAALHREPWDIVISDYNLPTFNGAEALRVLQSSGLDIPLILASGAIGEETAVDAMRAGARDFVMKDRLARLVPAVRRELAEAEQHRQRQTLATELRHEQDRFRALVEKSSEVIMVLDRDGRVTYDGPSVVRVLGYPPGTLSGRELFEWVHPDHQTELRADFAELLREAGATMTREFRCRHINDSWRWMEGAATNQLDDPSVRGIVVNLRDVSERKLTEQALDESRQRLQAILDHSPALIYMKDAAGRYILANRLFEQKFSSQGARVLGKTVSDIFPPQVAETRRADDLAAVFQGTPITREETTDEPDGRHTYLSVRFPLRDSRGHIYGMCGIATDITERKVLEAQFLHAQKMDAFGQLAGGVAHDFNNVLSAILIQLNLLRSSSAVSRDIDDGLKELEDTAQRAAGLTQQLLLFSRRQVVQKKAFDLNTLLAGLLKMLQRLLGDTVKLEFQPGQGDVWINADAGMIEQVVMNLCVNARDAMPHGGRLAVSTAVVDADQITAPMVADSAPRYVRLVASDNGCGMDETTLKRIFEPFFTTKEVGKGTGLGLATVYGIVTQHQGWIDVDSKVGAGTTFRIFLPQITGPPASATALAAPIPGGTETILLVEDDAAVRQFTATCLRRSGYRIIEATDGADAQKKFSEAGTHIDLLLTDTAMPGGISGLNLAQRLRRADDRMKVIITTGHSDEAAKLDAAITREIAFLAKPFDVSKLLATVRRVLSEHAFVPAPGGQAAPGFQRPTGDKTLEG